MILLSKYFCCIRNLRCLSYTREILIILLPFYYLRSVSVTNISIMKLQKDYIVLSICVEREYKPLQEKPIISIADCRGNDVSHV